MKSQIMIWLWKHKHFSWLLRSSWASRCLVSVGWKHDFGPEKFCGTYKNVGSVSLVGLQGSGSIPGHPGCQFTPRWPSPTSLPIRIRLDIGFWIDFLIFLLLLFRCNFDPAYRLIARIRCTCGDCIISLAPLLFEIDPMVCIPALSGSPTEKRMARWPRILVGLWIGPTMSAE